MRMATVSEMERNSSVSKEEHLQRMQVDPLLLEKASEAPLALHAFPAMCRSPRITITSYCICVHKIMLIEDIALVALKLFTLTTNNIFGSITVILALNDFQSMTWHFNQCL